MSEGGDKVKIGLATLWAIGVGSVLGGDFFGWQYVVYGGVISGLIAIAYTALFFWFYAGVVTELAARYRTSGGAFDFVNRALGLRAAGIMAILGFFKLLLATAAMAMAISSYLIQAGLPDKGRFIYWIFVYGIFTTLDCIGINESSNAQIFATCLCLAILIFYCISSLTAFTVSNVVSNGIFVDNYVGFFKGLPFALSLFDGFEELPLIMNYAINPDINIPAAVFYSYITIAIAAFSVFISGIGVSTNDTLLQAPAPLMISFNAVFGVDSIIAKIVSILVILGLLVNFFAFVVFTSQQVAAVASEGLLPKFLAQRHPVHGAPVYASICSTLIGLNMCASFTHFFGEQGAQFTLLTASLIPTVIGYAIMLQCIIKTREMEQLQTDGYPLNMRQVERVGFDPGRMRYYYGAYGARIGQIMCLIFLLSLLFLCLLFNDCFNGLIVVVFLGLLLYLLMVICMNRRLSVGDDIDAGEEVFIGVRDDKSVRTSTRYSDILGHSPVANTTLNTPLTNGEEPDETDRLLGPSKMSSSSKYHSKILGEI